MTLNDFYQKLESFDVLIAIYCIAVIVFAVILGFLSGKDKEKQSPWKYLYSLTVYATTVPGILQGIIAGYLLFIEKRSLMDLSLTVYILPVASMIITLLILSKSANLRTIPGFNRVSGLMLMLAASVVIVLILSKTRIWFIFHGSVWLFFVLIIGLFLIFRYGIEKFRGKSENENKNDLI